LPRKRPEYGFSKDNGRFNVTKDEADRHLFRVPNLRNVALTAPYFHNGSVATLQQAVRVMAKLQLDRVLTDDEASGLVAFLESLTGSMPKQVLPRLPETPGATLVEGSL
jgi:cytochrome c peroxidase